MLNPKMREITEYREKGPEWMSPTRTNDYDWCPRSFEAKWILGLDMEVSEILKIGGDIHDILFAFYMTIQNSQKIKYLLLGAVQKGYSETKKFITEIYDGILPDEVKGDPILMGMVENYIKLDAGRIVNIEKYLKRSFLLEDIDKYFIPVMFEQPFVWKETKKMGTEDRVDRMPPGYELVFHSVVKDRKTKEKIIKEKRFSVKFMVGDYKSRTPKYLLKWMAMSEAERIEKNMIDPKLTTKYRRQGSMYIDFVAKYLGFKKEDFGLFVVFLDTGLVVPEYLGKVTYTSREKLILKIRGNIVAYIFGKDAFKGKPYYKKCRECGNRNNCPDWAVHKKLFEDKKDD